MTTMNVSLPDTLKRFVDEEVKAGGFASTSDYMRGLIRQRQREKAGESLHRLIAEGLASGATTPVTAKSFTQMKQELRDRTARKAS
ncbi:MAG TPA: type II toxin-antitoxin system ParD family antitoxin [Nevskiaceae bacterium]|nr:type II toxin-antitoxin system ParD family antitoxin [Nevskiaceae bacterium]